jgi:nicotinamidase-related amidase
MQRAALLCIDVINAFDFDGCEPLVAAASSAAPRIKMLQQRAREANVPVVYVNDNFGQWRSDFHQTVQACCDPSRPGHAVSEQLRPVESDYFVLKPRHSGFFCTPLELLLQSLEVRSLVLVGFATNICVLFTASDAHMRGYDVVVPSDCTASNSQKLTQQALEHMELVSRATILESSQLDLSALQH